MNEPQFVEPLQTPEPEQTQPEPKETHPEPEQTHPEPMPAEDDNPDTLPSAEQQEKDDATLDAMHRKAEREGVWSDPNTEVADDANDRLMGGRGSRWAKDQQADDERQY